MVLPVYKTDAEGLEKASRIYLFAQDEFGKAVATVGFTFDELIYYCGKGLVQCILEGNYSQAITFNTLYVGQCVSEKLTQRFKAHHALQDMLIEERVISPDFDKTDEIILMPFCVDSYMSSMLTGFSSKEDWIKALTGHFDVTPNQISLDAEKAFVHGMNPKYNKIRFKKYPYSKDGLFYSDATVFCYAIAENIILKYDSGLIIGSSDIAYASSIIGDKEGYTNIFAPDENRTKRYAKAWYAELRGR